MTDRNCRSARLLSLRLLLLLTCGLLDGDEVTEGEVEDDEVGPCPDSSVLKMFAGKLLVDANDKLIALDCERGRARLRRYW